MTMMLSGGLQAVNEFLPQKYRRCARSVSRGANQCDSASLVPFHRIEGMTDMGTTLVAQLLIVSLYYRYLPNLETSMLTENTNSSSTMKSGTTNN